jgi:hypothetical protein
MRRNNLEGESPLNFAIRFFCHCVNNQQIVWELLIIKTKILLWGQPFDLHLDCTWSTLVPPPPWRLSSGFWTSGDVSNHPLIKPKPILKKNLSNIKLKPNSQLPTQSLPQPLPQSPLNPNLYPKSQPRICPSKI